MLAKNGRSKLSTKTGMELYAMALTLLLLLGVMPADEVRFPLLRLERLPVAIDEEIEDADDFPCSLISHGAS